MIDAAASALRAVTLESPLAYPLVFAAGVLSSAGPCVAPRYVAVAALAQGARRPWPTVCAFVAGVVGAYVALGLAAATIGSLWSASPRLYAFVALVLAAGGVVTLTGPAIRHSPHGARCADRRTFPGDGLAATVMLGAMSVLVVSPCCAPIVTAIAAATLPREHVFQAILLLGAFACGHSVPLAAAGALGERARSVLARVVAARASAVVSGGLMLSLAGYYAVLA